VQIYGKLIGGLIGLLTLRLPGLVIGVIVGHLFDRGLASTLRQASPENLARIQRSFFEATFLLLGHLAKADGRISQREVDHTEAIIARMQLNAEQRREAIELFHRGARADFQPETAVSAFLDVCGSQPQLHQTLLFFLVSLALADGEVESAEHRALQNVSMLLGYTQRQLDQFLRMARAQSRFHGDAGAAPSPGARLQDAYAALGVGPDTDDKSLKRAYRKLMSENHPDKLIARGVPEEMIKLATERSQEIQAAYETVRRARAAR